MNNLSALSLLLRLDALRLIRWFRDHTLGKIVIFLLSLATFAFIALFIYSGAIGFLFPLTTFEVYGQLTALYLVHAALIVTLWLGIGTSLVAGYSFLVRFDRELDYLLTLPVSQTVIVLRAFLVSLFSSLLWSLIIFLPLGLAVLRLFGLGLSPQTVFYLIFVISFVIISSSAIGNFFAFLLVHLHRFLRPALYLPLLALLYILVTLFLIRALLPTDLARLLPASASQFLPLFNNLPLNRIALPTQALTNLFLGLWSNSLYSVIAGLLLFLILTLIYESRRFGQLRRVFAGLLQVSVYVKKPHAFFYNANLALTAKDTLTTLRNPTEFGYGLFLLLLVLSFFIFLASSIRATTSEQRLYSIAIYGFIWFLFYAVAYLMRLVFPLMASEGQTAWFLFTKPMRFGKIINQKTLSALVIGLPLMAIGLIIWPFLVAGRQLWPLALVSVIFLTLIASYFGNFFPNFREGHNRERVSTSAMGLFTVVVLLTVSYFLATQPILATAFSFFLFLISALVILIFLKSLSVLALRRYQF